MAPHFDMLDSVVPHKEAYRFRLRVLRLWKVPGYINPDQPISLEMVFVDEHGTKIQASVRKTLVYKFIDLLKEGSAYRFAYFGVVPNIGSYRATSHQFRLVFQMRTTVVEVECAALPRYSLSCLPFDRILSMDSEYDFLTDVMGVLTGVSSDREYLKDGKVTKMLVMELTDLKGKLECTIFGDFVDQLKAYLSTANRGPPIVILLYSKIKIYKGTVVVQNSMHSSQLLLDPDLPEAIELKRGLVGAGFDFKEPLSFAVGLPRVSIEEDFLHGFPRKSISGFINSDVVCI